LIDGKRITFKTLSNVTLPDFTGAVIRRIREAATQAPNVLIDARGQASMDEEAARQVIRTIQRSSRNVAVESIRVIGTALMNK